MKSYGIYIVTSKYYVIYWSTQYLTVTQRHQIFKFYGILNLLLSLSRDEVDRVDELRVTHQWWIIHASLTDLSTLSVLWVQFVVIIHQLNEALIMKSPSTIESHCLLETSKNRFSLIRLHNLKAALIFLRQLRK